MHKYLKIKPWAVSFAAQFWASMLILLTSYIFFRGHNFSEGVNMLNQIFMGYIDGQTMPIAIIVGVFTGDANLITVSQTTSFYFLGNIIGFVWLYWLFESMKISVKI